MKSLVLVFGGFLTIFVIFLWLCGRSADMRPITSAPKEAPLVNSPYTRYAKHPPVGSHEPRYSVAEIGNIRSSTDTTTIMSHQDASGRITKTVKQIPLHSLAPSGPHLRQLRPLPGYQFARALGINHHGQIVGFCRSVGSGAWTVVQDRAFLWQRGKMHSLEALPNYEMTDAVALNDGDIIVGYTTIDSFPSDMDIPSHAVCWIAGKIRDLGTGGAVAVNNRGEIVGDSGTGPADYSHDPHALLWMHGYRYDLNDYIPRHSGWVLMEARAINDRDQIVGTGTLDGKPRTFLLTPRTNRK